jgi:hypothetical protein
MQDWDAFSDGVAAAAVAGIVGAVPSTVYALLTGRPVTEASLAAGTLLLPGEERRGRLLAAAVPVHLTLSLGWALPLAVLLPRRGTVMAGALAGLGIAAIDLGLVGRRYARIAALPVVPQVMDHVAYATAAALVVKARRSRRPSTGQRAP